MSPAGSVDLAEADRHRPLVETGLVADAPAQVDRLEPGATAGTQLAEAGEDGPLQGVALGLEVTERRADKVRNVLLGLLDRSCRHPVPQARESRRPSPGTVGVGDAVARQCQSAGSSGARTKGAATYDRPVAADLERFVAAQREVYPGVLDELRRGRKTGHWIWFIFPQIAGLGRSATSQAFAIHSLTEARAYLAHPILGARLRECASIVAAADGRGRRRSSVRSTR